MNQKKPKRNRPESIQGLSECLLNWFNKARYQKVPISSKILQLKAREFSSALGAKDFKGSNGWLQKWCNKHKITSKMFHGESLSADLNGMNQWLDNILPRVFEEFQLDLHLQC